MYSRKGGSLDVVCSSERKKSGLTLRPQHAVPCPWRTFGESLTTSQSPRPLEEQMGVQGEGKARAHSPPHLSPYPCSEAPVPPAV